MKSKIEVGDRVIYRCYGITKTSLIKNEDDIHKFLPDEGNKAIEVEVLKIERPEYKIVEEKKELLTAEEREFLKKYLKFTSNEYEKKYFKRNTGLIWLEDEAGNGLCFRYNIDKFKNMELGKEYTLQELGLEEI